jgi:hypothetical protein
MFTSSFPFSKINSQHRTLSGRLYIEHNYSFRGKTNKRYIVILEQYEFSVFSVKFCIQEHKNFDDRFNRLTNLNECSRVISTVGMIMKSVLDKNPYASFAFVGSPLSSESEENTKRFRLYSKVVENLISPVVFEHKIAVSKSIYLMINRNNLEVNLIDKLTEMFKDVLE